jgi:orotidine-5'-phosphate decarboxylase
MASYLNAYADRAKNHINPAARHLLETIERKRSNLCVSVDVTSSKDFLSIIDAVGPYVSLIKASRGICRPTWTSTLTVLKLDSH